MKIKLLIAAGATVVLASVIALVVIVRSGGADGRRLGPQDPKAEGEVAAARSSPQGLVELYVRWAGMNDKYLARLHIIELLAETPDSRAGLALIIEAISGDSVPLERDPIIDDVAQRMQKLWQAPGTFDYGRDVMLVQTNDKVRVVLAHSLVVHMRGVTKDVEGQRRAWLTNDLVDVYYRSSDPARERLLVSMRALGATDLVKAMSGAKPMELDVVQDRVRQTETAITDLRARNSDPSLKELRGAMRQVTDVDRKQIETELTRTDDTLTRPH